MKLLSNILKLVLIFTGLFVLVLAVANGIGYMRFQMEASQPQPAPLPDLLFTERLEILPLFEKAGDPDKYQIGHGVAYLIRTDTSTILLDLGMNIDQTDPSPLEVNMLALGITWDEIDTIVISHPHPDHVGGVEWQIRNTFSSGMQQPDFSTKSIYVPESMTYPDSIASVETSGARIAKGVGLTGTLPFFDPFILSPFNPLRHEQSLLINVRGVGLILIAGCGHPGLDAMIGRAEAITGLQVAGVIGGLHYGNQTADQLQDEIAILKSRDLAFLALSPHDSSPATIGIFAEAFADVYQPIEIGVPFVISAPVTSR